MKFVEPIWEKEKIQEFRKALKEEFLGERNLLMFELQLCMALRISDVLKLQKKDVIDGIVRIKIQKTKEPMHFRLPDHVLQKVKVYTEFMEDEELLFPIDRIQAWRIYQKGAKKIGLSNFGTHTIRKTKALHFYLDSGNDIRATMQLLGHDDEDSVLSYIGLKQKDLAEKIKAHQL